MRLDILVQLVAYAVIGGYVGLAIVRILERAFRRKVQKLPSPKIAGMLKTARTQKIVASLSGARLVTCETSGTTSYDLHLRKLKSTEEPNLTGSRRWAKTLCGIKVERDSETATNKATCHICKES